MQAATTPANQQQHQLDQQVSLIIQMILHRFLKTCFSVATHITLFIVTSLIILIALPVVIVLATVFIAVVLSLLLLFALFSHLHNKEEEWMARKDVLTVSPATQSGKVSPVDSPLYNRKVYGDDSQNHQDGSMIFGNLSEADLLGDVKTAAIMLNYQVPTDVIQYQIFPYLSHVELLSHVKLINKRFHYLVKNYYEMTLLHDLHDFRNQCLVQLLYKEWNVESSFIAKQSLYNCVQSSKIWNSVQKKALTNEIQIIENGNLVWTFYKKFLMYTNAQHWHDDAIQVLAVYRYGVALCCTRPKTFFRLLLTPGSSASKKKVQ